MKVGRKWLPRLLGLALFVLVLARVDVIATTQVLARGQWFFFLLTLPLFIANIAVKTWRWHLLMCDQDINLPVGGLFAAYLGSFYIGLITPGRLGEFIKAFYVKSAGYSLSCSSVSTLIDRAFDLVVLAAWGYMGMCFHASAFGQALLILGALTGIGFIVLGLLWLRADWRRWLLEIAFNYLVPGRFRQVARLRLDEFYHECRRLQGWTLLAALLLSIVSWLIYFGQVYLLASALDIDITFLRLSVFVAISSLLSTLPITLSGIGTRDAALVYLFGTAGLPGEAALALSLLMLALRTVSGGISLAAWLRQPIRVEGKL